MGGGGGARGSVSAPVWLGAVARMLVVQQVTHKVPVAPPRLRARSGTGRTPKQPAAARAAPRGVRARACACACVRA